MRLAARPALAMMLVTTTSLAVVVVSQAFVARSELRRLPDELRVRLFELRTAEDAPPWPFMTPLRPPPEGAGLRTAEGTTSLQWAAWAVGRVQDAPNGGAWSGGSPSPPWPAWRRVTPRRSSG